MHPAHLLHLFCRNGRLDIRIENAVFDVHEYNEFLKSVAGKPRQTTQGGSMPRSCPG